MGHGPVRDELCLLQQCPEVSFGCDILVFDVVFKLSLSLLHESTHKECRLLTLTHTIILFHMNF